MTGYPGDTLAHRGAVKPARVVQKPFTVTQLARNVREVLDAA
jgi:hypothetical protein